MRSIHRTIVSALIYSKDNKIFFGRKAENKGGVYNDFWHLPGGGVDEGESQQEALIREIEEEVGIDISPYKIELIDNKGKGTSEKVLRTTHEKVICHISFNVYKVVIDNKTSENIEVSLDDDLVQYIWIDVSQIGTIKHTPPSIKLFKRLGYLK